MNRVTYTLFIVLCLMIVGFVLFFIGFGDHFFLTLSGLMLLVIALWTVKRAQKRDSSH